MADILAQICDDKQAEVAARKARQPRAALADAIAAARRRVASPRHCGRRPPAAMA